jgi:hypothetical protein
MSQIDNIVQVSISRQTTQVDIASFDIPLLMVPMTDSDAGFTDRVRTYTSLSGVAQDLGINHVGYKMASQLLSGDLKPATFKIGKVNKEVGDEETYPEAIQAVMDLDDTWYAVMAASHLDADIRAIADYIQPLRKLYFTSTSSQLAYQQSQSVEYTATVAFDITGAAEDDTIDIIIAGERYRSTLGASTWGPFAYVGTGSGTFAGTFTLAPLTGVVTVENTVVAYTVTSAEQAIAAGFTGQVPAEDISATEPVGMDIGQTLKFKSLDRTIIMFSNTADSEFPEASWVGPQIVEVPGSNTWEYKQLNGVTVSRLTDSQITILESRGYNYYIPVKGVNITRRGKVAEGEWVDVMILVDWIHARMQEQIFFRLVNSRKIPFTDAGATIIENEIRSVLAQAQANNGIDQYTVKSPRVLSIPEIQRNARVMGDFTFDARLAGAVSVVIIRGVVHA